MRIKKTAITVIWSLVLFCFLLSGGSKVWAESISVAEYRLRIQESLGHLEEGEGEMGPEEISWFRQSFPPDLVVEDPGGQRFLVDRKDLLRLPTGSVTGDFGMDRGNVLESVSLG